MSGKHFHRNAIVRGFRHFSSRIMAVMLAFALVGTMIPFMPLLASGKPVASGGKTEVGQTTGPGKGGSLIDQPSETDLPPGTGDAGSDTPGTPIPGTDLPGGQAPGGTSGEGGATTDGAGNDNAAATSYTLKFIAGKNGSFKDIPDGLLELKVEAGKLWSEVKLPTPLPDAGYVFIGWNPELPAGELAVSKDDRFTAKFVDVKTAKAGKQKKGGGQADQSDDAPSQGGAASSEQPASDSPQGIVATLAGTPHQYTIQYWLVADGVETYNSSQTLVGIEGEAVTADPNQFSYPGYSYNPNHYSSYPSATVPVNNGLVLRLYYHADVTVSYDLGDGNWLYAAPDNPAKHAYLSTIQLPGNVNGSFVGWMAGTGGPVLSAYSNYTVTGSVTFYAQYSQNGTEAAISVAPGLADAYYGDSTVADDFQLRLLVDVNEAAQAQMPGEVFTHPERILIGWSNAPGKETLGAGDAALGGLATISSDGSTQAWYGVWAPSATYRQGYLPGDHGTFTGVEYYAAVGDPTPAPPEGYELPDDLDWHFVGWSPEWSDMVSGDTVYVAQWSRDYLIHFDVGGNTTPVAPIGISDDDFAAPLGQSIGSLPQPSPAEGLEFEGWSTDPDSGTPVDENTSYSDIVGGDNAVESVTLFAGFKPLAVDIILTKIWEDNGNEYGNRPVTVTFELYENGMYIKDVAFGGLSTANTWTHTVTGLSGSASDYTVSESTVPDGYEMTDNSGTTITNSTVLTAVSLTKVWSDNSDEYRNRPDDVEFELSANGRDFGTYTLTDDGTDTWDDYVNDLPVYINGEEAVYRVTEKEVPGYTPTYRREGKTELTVTNTTATTTVILTKVWDDSGNVLNNRPPSVDLDLYGTSDGNPTPFSFGSHTLTSSGADTWTFDVPDLPTYINKNKAEYTVEEPNVPLGYDDSPKIQGTTVTNKLATTPITITKVWEDDDDGNGESNDYGNRPGEVTLDFYVDGTWWDDYTLSGFYTDTWTYSVDAPTYKDGQPLLSGDYTVDEPSVPDGYDITDNSGTTITNSTALTWVSLTKEWDDDADGNGESNDYGNRPDEVELRLSGGGRDFGSYTLTDDGTDTWHYDLPKILPTHINGIEVVYSVSEDPVPDGYSVAYQNSNTEPVAVNTTAYAPVTLTKVWADDANARGDRPASVELELRSSYQGNLGSYTLTDADSTDANTWAYTWPDDLLTHANGQAIVYTVVEPDPPVGYYMTTNGLTATNAKIINVTFDPNAADATIPPANATAQVTFGLRYGAPVTTATATASRPGYTFSGWYTAPTGGTLVTADTFVTNINDHTLYARWTANGDTPYTVYHWLIALDGSRSPGARVDLTGQTDTIAYAPPRTFTGYTLNTSYPGTVASGNIAANGSLQLHLYYVAIPPPPPPPPPPPAPTNPPITQVEQPTPTTVPPTPTPTTPAPPPSPTPPAPTPPPPTDIADPVPPQTITPAPAKQGAWALLNLILSILGALLAAIALLRFALARRQEEDVEQDGSTTTSYRPHARWWILTLAATVLAVVIFLITEDMRLPITLADWWTIVHAIILIIQLAFFVLAMRRTGDEDDGQQRQGDQANYA